MDEQNNQNYNIHLNQDRPKPDLEEKKLEHHKEIFQHDEEEIDLKDYIEVLIKKKWAILSIFLVTVITAGVVSFIIPPIYQASNLIEIGQIKKAPLQSLEDLKAIFERISFLKKIENKIKTPLELTENITPETIFNMFNIEKSVEGAGYSKFIKIKGRANTPEKAVIVVNAVTEILLEYHQNLFSMAEKTFNIEMETIKNSKEKTKKDIERIKQDIIRINQDIQKYEQEINKRADIQTEGQGRIAESYINLLATSKNQKENKESQLIGLEQQLVSLDQVIQQKEYEKVYETKPTKVEVEAVSPETRIAPKRKQNVVIAGILGIFIGIFYAFCAEYFCKEKTS